DIFAPELFPLLEDSVRFHQLPYTSPIAFPKELNRVAYHRQLLRIGPSIIQDSRPDILYHRLGIINFAALRIARRLDIPIVIEYNGSEVWAAKNWGGSLLLAHLARLSEGVLLRHADLVITVSDVLREELLRRGIPQERIFTHPNCVDPRRFDPARFS